MLNFGPTFIWVAVNFLFLFFVLRKVLFKPVTEHMENRKKSIKDALDSAHKKTLEADELHKKYGEQLKTAKEEADRIVGEARARAEKEYEEILNNARQDAAAFVAKAREGIQMEREQMVKEIKNQVAALALSAASKVVEANMDTEGNRKLVDKFIDEAGAA